MPDRHLLKGMMHGFIDLIFERDGQFFVADYKSTYLGDQIEDYSVNAMQQNIFDNFYDLQYSLYSLALHRYLKIRLPNYQPEQHFGGVYYFYLRGMNAKTNAGVFYAPLSVGFFPPLDSVFNIAATQGAE